MSEIKTKRVHISGLNPEQCSVQDLYDRFESFQLQVQEVHNWPPGKDSVGNVQNWCFVTLRGEAAKIKRSIEVLNGTVWKGTKLRIGTAKKKEWKQESTEAEEDVEVDLEMAKKEKKKKKARKSKGVESETIDQPVTMKDVEEGLWGWKKTPAGHLLRPVHLRPSHPLPLPCVERKDAEMKGMKDEEKKERRRRKAGSIRSLTRAKRVTIDPSRYGAVHMAGPILDDGTESLARGSEWFCEETEDGDVKWELRDEYGKVLNEEFVQLRKQQEQIKDVTSSLESDEEDDDSTMDEVAAAIENAESDLSLSEEEEEEEEEEEVRVQGQPEASVEKATINYDPGEESDFSEGYQEMQDGINVRTRDWEEEKAGHLKLLKNMFGGEGLPSKAEPPALVMPDLAEESEEEEQQQEDITAQVIAPLTGAQKRAALLGTFTAGQHDATSFKPLTRFDPGVEDSSSREMADVEMADDKVVEEGNKVEEVRVEESVPSEAQAPREDRVQMSSLKDMFRPKEDSAGFTLLGDLDLDLEEELEEEEQVEEPKVEHQQNEVVTTNHLVQRDNLSVELPFFFPTWDKHDQSWFNLLSKDSSNLSFCKDKTDEEIQAQWKERKGQLTQDYKRRHREALKKKKRKYTGSRAAGTSIPVRF